MEPHHFHAVGISEIIKSIMGGDQNPLSGRDAIDFSFDRTSLPAIDQQPFFQLGEFKRSQKNIAL